MGELLAGAERVAALGRQQKAEAAARVRAEQAKHAEWAAMRPQAEGRVREFIGYLVGNNIPTVALYEPQHRVRDRGPFLGKQTYTSGYARIGDGWLARRERYTYEEGTTSGIFVCKNNLAVVSCGQIKRDPPSDARNFHEEGEYVVASWGPNLDAPVGPDTPVVYDGPPLFATDEGKLILEEALVRYGIVS